MSLPKQIKSKNVTPAGGSSTPSSVAVFDSSDFTYTASEISSSNLLAQLTDQYAPYYYIASFHSTVDGTWSRDGGSLTNATTGTVTISGGKAVLTSGSFADIIPPAQFNVPLGNVFALRFKLTPNYTGNPANDQEIMTTSIGAGDNTNLVRIQHESTGTLNFICSGLSSTKTVTASWSPTASQEYEFYYLVDYDSGLYFAAIDGVTFGTPQTGSQSRRFWQGLFKIGETYVDTLHVANFSIRDFVYYDSDPFTTDYTPGYTIEDTRYPLTDPSMETTSGIASVATLQSLSVVYSAAGSDTIQGQIRVGSQLKYWDGAAWSDSDGTYAQSSTIADLQTNISSLTTSGSAVKLVFLLHSDDGSTTPYFLSATVEYT